MEAALLSITPVEEVSQQLSATALLLFSTVSTVVIAIITYIFYPAIHSLYCGPDSLLVNQDFSHPTTTLADDNRNDIVLLSLIIPAYNEEERLPPMLDQTIDSLQTHAQEIVEACHDSIGLIHQQQQQQQPSLNKTSNNIFEIIIVDDGSTDDTCNVVRKKYKPFMTNSLSSSSFSPTPKADSNTSTNITIRLRILQLRTNSGKGAAVRTGMLHSNGELRLMLDADGATEFHDGLMKVLNEMVATLQLTTTLPKIGQEEQGTPHKDGDDNSVKQKKKETTTTKKKKDDDTSATNGSSTSTSLLTTATSATTTSSPPPPPLPPPGAVVIFGSRAHLEKESITKRSAVRTFLMKSFHFFVRTIIFCSTASTTTTTATSGNNKKNKPHSPPSTNIIRDTQCGFKLFTRTSSILLFTNLHLQRWAFDIELVYMAQRLFRIPIREVNVKWHEVRGSKLDCGNNKFKLALVSLNMLRDMICVRVCYESGLWKIQKKGKQTGEKGGNYRG